MGHINAGTNQTLTLGGTTNVAGFPTLTVNGSNGYILVCRRSVLGTSATFSPSSGSTLNIGSITGGFYPVLTFSGAGTTNVTGAITDNVANRSLAVVFNQTGTVTLSGNSDLPE